MEVDDDGQNDSGATLYGDSYLLNTDIGGYHFLHNRETGRSIALENRNDPWQMDTDENEVPFVFFGVG